MYRKVRRILSLLTVASTIAGCSMVGDEEKSSPTNDQVKRVESKTGGPDKGLLNTWFGLNEGPGGSPGSSSAGISVNGFLWRAALDTISFMPLAQADPFGGIILTDWYRPSETETERFKVNVYILDSELRADGLRVSVFRQRRDAGGTWVNAKVSAETGTSFENAILKRARQMRVSRQ
jgi:hypothetical protein